MNFTMKLQLKKKEVVLYYILLYYIYIILLPIYRKGNQGTER